jgi:hypothetical protein
MKQQSAIEFLTVYGFVFMIIAIVIVIVFILASSPKNLIPSQCSSFGGPSCISTYLYTNQNSGYLLLTVLIENSEEVPINITNFSSTVSNYKGVGTCNPAILYPGQEAVCKSIINAAISQYNTVSGFYNMKAQFCDQNINNANAGCSITNTVNYTGSFTQSASPIEPLILAITAARIIPNNKSSVAFQTSPQSYLQNNMKIIENGDLAGSLTGYMYTANSADFGGEYLGFHALQYPSQISSLNNNASCKLPYNSTFSLASGIYYMKNAGSLKVSAFSANDIEVYYKPANAAAWSSIFNGAAWNGGGATQYGPDTVSVNSGFYDIVIASSSTCSYGIQGINVTGEAG